MSGGVRTFPSRRASAPLLSLIAMAGVAALAPSPAQAQGTLQDLVGTYSLTERDVEGEWCANVPMDVQQVSTLDVTAIDDDSVAIAMDGPSFEVPFDASARTFRYDIEQSGYRMSITGQFVRGRDNVAMAMVFSWQPQIDCVASLTGSKSAPDLGAGETAAVEGGDFSPGGGSDWGWLENPVVVALLALLMALTAAGVAFSRKSDEAEPAPMPEPGNGGSGGGGPLAALTRSVAPLSGMPNPLSAMAPLSGSAPGLDQPIDPVAEATAAGLKLTAGEKEFLDHKKTTDFKERSQDEFKGTWLLPDGSRAVLTMSPHPDNKHTNKENYTYLAITEDGQIGRWGKGPQGITIRWESLNRVDFLYPSGSPDVFDAVSKDAKTLEYINKRGQALHHSPGE
ncbi:MAG: hypothetical protein ACREBO_08530 [Novosphingobium sp.]